LEYEVSKIYVVFIRAIEKPLKGRVYPAHGLIRGGSDLLLYGFYGQQMR